MNTEVIWNFLTTQGADFGLKVLGALAAWIVGRWLIGMALRGIGAALKRGGKIDATLAAYLTSIIGVILNIVLILSILDIFGVKTTSFAALLAGAGLAIGTAWGGLLTHFAAGVFMQVLRPYKVGDFVQAGGVVGTVKELGLFGTTIITPDNVTTIVDAQDAMARLRTALAATPNVIASPAPEVDILQSTPEGPLLAVRPYTHTDHYWQVYFDAHKAVVTTFGAAGYPVPETPQVHRKV